MNQVQKVVMALCRTVDTPRSLTVYLMAKAGEWAQLQALRLRSPGTYSSSEEYRKDALVTEFLRKCNLSHITNNDTRATAVQTFWACETRCARTNSYLRNYLPEHLLLEDPGQVRIHDFIREVRKDIAYVLGGLPLDLTPRFSAGATVSDRVPLTTIPDKMTSIPTIYPQATDLLPFYWESGWGRVNSRRRIHPEVTRGNIFFTVPKDSEKDRGCAKEASIAVGFQLDTARHIRARLRSRLGIDISSSEAEHRRIAQKASLDGLLATLDMSNASDTICRVLVELLLPKEWFTLLDSLRARFTRIDGKWVRLEKFSSMGNGFTFELETLIFACMTRTLVYLEGGDPHEVRCHGDDLICPTANAVSVLSMLRYFGFEPNEKKSFWEGPFRESCGGDFFDGQPVRAYYLKELPDEPQHWIALANGLNRVDPTGVYVHAARKECLENIPRAIRQCRGPATLGDLTIHYTAHEYNRAQLDGDDRCAGELRANGLRYFRTYSPVQLVFPLHHWHEDVALQAMLLGQSSTGVSPRDAITGYRLTWTVDPNHSDWLPTLVH